MDTQRAGGESRYRAALIAWHQEHKSELRAEAAAREARDAAVIVKKTRRLVAEAAKERTEMDKAAIEALAAQLAELVSLHPRRTAAMIRELLPPYVAQHISGQGGQ